MRHKWANNINNQLSKHNKICIICGCEKIKSPYSTDVEYKHKGETFYKTPRCNN